LGPVWAAKESLAGAGAIVFGKKAEEEEKKPVNYLLFEFGACSTRSLAEGRQCWYLEGNAGRKKGPSGNCRGSESGRTAQPGKLDFNSVRGGDQRTRKGYSDVCC